MPRYEPKSGGVLRVNRGREVEARCLECALYFGSTGPAASHARSSRHPVEVHYRALFTYAPAELLDGAR